jgi:hypothetical protein
MAIVTKVKRIVKHHQGAGASTNAARRIRSPRAPSA